MFPNPIDKFLFAKSTPIDQKLNPIQENLIILIKKFILFYIWNNIWCCQLPDSKLLPLLLSLSLFFKSKSLKAMFGAVSNLSGPTCTGEEEAACFLFSFSFSLHIFLIDCYCSLIDFPLLLEKYKLKVVFETVTKVLWNKIWCKIQWMQIKTGFAMLWIDTHDKYIFPFILSAFIHI